MRKRVPVSAFERQHPYPRRIQPTPILRLPRPFCAQRFPLNAESGDFNIHEYFPSAAKWAQNNENDGDGLCIVTPWELMQHLRVRKRHPNRETSH
ncbi:hypothetical protein EMIT0P294_30579 [Pseudomonas sp. IT-P294]